MQLDLVIGGLDPCDGVPGGQGVRGSENVREASKPRLFSQLLRISICPVHFPETKHDFSQIPITAPSLL